uniref:Uncharacterized protein n=1 Tax=Globodera rostochiensis TaxID=31243 RepID=A0A914I0R1_GLORO
MLVPVVSAVLITAINKDNKFDIKIDNMANKVDFKITIKPAAKDQEVKKLTAELCEANGMIRRLQGSMFRAILDLSGNEQIRPKKRMRVTKTEYDEGVLAFRKELAVTQPSRKYDFIELSDWQRAPCA